MSKTGSSQRENHQRPNETALTPAGGHDIPAAINSPGHRQGHGLSPGLKVQIEGVLTCQRLPDPSLPYGDPLALIRSRLGTVAAFSGVVVAHHYWTTSVAGPVNPSGSAIVTE
jgi:hypothetical protein